ncbi:tripartite tricarboxylate transporter permease [Pelagibacterium halotolerans]|uniref:Tricarboxylate transport membrane protein TctA n=1 Tax=Pelagibacterium halotolerans (strain DSM 22347 / JCM 15775 / CGMCC 1.7692 / B2) TaxID=1082931 RepID=G4RAN0_PELHB|nr:tripartite tricarboxylate transporter permease [Pelagibacterium halotolerans]AEQ52553.1 tricarboxylate transport membrane protein TctA [Pelagibacterium halotolerans B2]QJR17728.1 tripartite tricarboxylate transporter permease [Pelagibacterium halotolerans]SEA39958.1 TctA family transporter [Pelagibacterium halotolerans]
MLELAWPALVDIFDGNSIWFLLIGSLIGFVFAVLPGLSGPQVLALLLPVTFTMPSNDAIILLMGAAGVSAFGGSLTAILINAPGTAQSAATVFDGYPLTRQGRAGYAIGAAAFSSLLGAIFGAVVLTLILPLGRYVVLAFSYPEYFMLAVMGLAMIAVLSQGSPWKSIMAGGIGFTLAFIGIDTTTGALRYTFGWDYLWDGIKLVPAIIGLFGIAEALAIFGKPGAISKEPPNTSLSGIFEGCMAVFGNFGVFLRSATIGTIIGIIPGVGGAVANFVSYGQTVATAKDKSRFGKGDIRGVIAPESANNAKDGGSLVPTLIFGIPGSLEMAVLLGALTLHGINPGPRLMLDHGNIALLLIYALVLSNIFIAVFGVLIAKPLTHITRIRTVFIAPVIMVLGLMGAYATNGYIEDAIVALAFGVIGYIMMRFDYSRIALLIALVLGTLLQNSFHQTNDLWGIAGFFNRPISLTLFFITVLMLAMPAIVNQVQKRHARQ